jgi:uncharacterized protein (TIGR01655 family)
LDRKKSKKKHFKIIIVILIAVPLALGTLWFKQYYDNRYVLDDYYYTIVPLDYDITPTTMYNSNGADMGLEKVYDLICYNADGNEKKLEFRARLDFQELYPPGTYVRVSVSKTMVLQQNALDESDVPEKALEMIKKNFIPSETAALSDYAEERTRLLQERNTEEITVTCTLDGTTLIYAYLYKTEDRVMAEAAAGFLEPVYRAQFRADNAAFPELTAIVLEIKIDDGTMLFSERYNERVKFGYELNN